ncbi:NADH-ubiquinone oxidoreductase-F iron-sulfur binding region domain-containing protein [Hydrogenophilus thiooxidans]|uniref:NADH-ubiquinone oxidoreductase-F iron-sulfur binding region domain-containing protein n=1 Tax=Hydrogenophilus thiooxidans TaxID=2820326 RepID=UPI001C225406|nr:NADH-ubiquinone oxidoreductase-F iron-sulfur binding region domain-containing protein [Hydrogenophilus thiooxidans]
MATERQRTAPGLLAALHQARLRWGNPLEEPALAELSAAFALPPGEIAATASFYHFFQTPPARYQIHFIDHVVDHHAGIEALCNRLCAAFAIQPGERTADAHLFVGWTACAGLSDQAPAAIVNGRPLPALTPERIDAIIDAIRAQIPVAEWPAEWFAVANPVYRRGPLLTWLHATPAAAVLEQLSAREPEAILQAVADAGLRGRGGAGFPTATKWRFCRETADPTRYLICNADEGEPGTFKDRLLLTHYPDHLFAGMTLAARAIGAQTAMLYLRYEYQYLLPKLEAARERILAAQSQLPPSERITLEIALGAGAYVCGEESALIESLEGKPGRPRVRPPFPVTSGYLGQPTVVNNVETLVAVAAIVGNGPQWWRSMGTPDSSGPKLFCVSGDVARPGLYEFPYGVALGDLITAARPLGTPYAIQVSGPSGTLLPATPEQLARPLAFEALPCNGTVMVFDERRDPVAIVRHFARFFAHESCGFCTPCRVGTQLIAKTFAKIAAGYATRFDLERLAPALEAMRLASNCGFGLSAGNPVRDLIAYFRPRLDAHLQPHDFLPAFSLDAELAATRRLTGRDDTHAHLAQFEQPEAAR